MKTELIVMAYFLGYRIIRIIWGRLRPILARIVPGSSLIEDMLEILRARL